MTKTLAQIQRQIAKLEKEAEKIRRQEASGVIARVREAIAHYGLTPEDLFGAAKGRRKAVNTLPTANKAPKAKPGTAAKRKTVPVKYRDSSGNTWTGRGNKPRWLAAALASGKRIEDFLI